MANGRKTGGRTKGTPNKRTAEEIDRADRVLSLIESKYLESDIAKLTSAQRLMLYADMMEYKVPKLSRTTVVGDKDNPIGLQISLTDGDIRQLNQTLENDV